VEIRRFEVRPLEESGVWAFRAAVSPGTYIRALVRDLGRDLGCGGTLRSLRRLSIGPMDLEAAVTPDQIGSDPAVLERTLVPLDSIPLDLRDYRLDTPLEAQRFLSGASIWLHEESESVGSVRVLSPEGTLLGVGEVQPGALQPRVVLGS
jgi:tRNA pseudouridine55 synthase